MEQAKIFDIEVLVADTGIMYNIQKTQAFNDYSLAKQCYIFNVITDALMSAVKQLNSPQGSGEENI